MYHSATTQLMTFPCSDIWFIGILHIKLMKFNLLRLALDLLEKMLGKGKKKSLSHKKMVVYGDLPWVNKTHTHTKITSNIL